MTRTTGGYKVSEDGGAFKLPCFERTLEDWMLEVKMFSTMYPQGDKGNVRCQYNTRFLSSDKLCHTVCIHSWCLQLLFSVTILQMIVIYLICQKRVEESLSWQTLGVNRARQVFKLNLLNLNLPTSNLPNLNLPNSSLIQICQIWISKKFEITKFEFTEFKGI